MNKLFIFIVFSILVFSCSSTSYITQPSWGYAIKPRAKLIVRITNSTYDENNEATKATINVLKECPYIFMTSEELADINHRYFLHLEESWIPDSTALKRLNLATDYDYFLTGGWATTSNYSNSMSFYCLTEQEVESDIDPNRKEEKFIYLLYDIKSQKLVLSLATNSKSVSVGADNNRKVRLPMNTQTKALQILKDKLNCNYSSNYKEL